MEEFVKLFDEKDFIRQFCNTQTIASFIEGAARSFEKQPFEVQYFDSCLQAIEEKSLFILKLQQNKEIETTIGNYLHPVTIDLHQIISAVSPEKEPEKDIFPRQARFETIEEVELDEDELIEGHSIIMEEGPVAAPYPTSRPLRNIESAFQRFVTNQGWHRLNPNRVINFPTLRLPNNKLFLAIKPVIRPDIQLHEIAPVKRNRILSEHVSAKKRTKTVKLSTRCSTPKYNQEQPQGDFPIMDDNMMSEERRWNARSFSPTHWNLMRMSTVHLLRCPDLS